MKTTFQIKFDPNVPYIGSALNALFYGMEFEIKPGTDFDLAQTMLKLEGIEVTLKTESDNRTTPLGR